MKKFAAIALAASMVLGLSGCGKQRICPDQRYRHSGASNLFFSRSITALEAARLLASLNLA